MKVLAGDIGGTNSRLALCEVAGARVHALAEQTFASSDYGSLSEVVRTFLAGAGAQVHSACFGLPGPVRGRRAQLTNLPWLVDADTVERELGLDDVWLLNDLESYAYGLATLEPTALRQIKPGIAMPRSNAALIAAGTGLGEAGLAWDGRTSRPFASEGGHSDFAPSTPLEDELLVHLRAIHGHVSWERVVSGPGLVAIHTFLLVRSGAEAPAWMNVPPKELSPLISDRGRDGSDPLCVQALSMFLGLYGAEAGNLALKHLALGGLYVGGGIAPKLVDMMGSSPFVERFVDKGRMQPLLTDVPVYVVLDDHTGIWGAASYAAARGQASK
ncbi:MAG: glucokinase [Deltaproteobacteria bacterium]|nr:glucokinase [Nannocystaceae bacterium]